MVTAAATTTLSGCESEYPEPRVAIVTDVDGDGREDLAVRCAIPADPASILMWTSSPSGQFSATSADRSWSGEILHGIPIAAGDADGDGYGDLWLSLADPLLGSARLLLGGPSEATRPSRPQWPICR